MKSRKSTQQGFKRSGGQERVRERRGELRSMGSSDAPRAAKQITVVPIQKVVSGSLAESERGGPRQCRARNVSWREGQKSKQRLGGRGDRPAEACKPSPPHSSIRQVLKRRAVYRAVCSWTDKCFGSCGRRRDRRLLLVLLHHQPVRQDQLVLAAGLADHQRDLFGVWAPPLGWCYR